MTDEGCGVPPYTAALSWNAGGSAGTGASTPARPKHFRPIHGHRKEPGLMVPCPHLLLHPRNAKHFRVTRNGGAR